MGEDQSSPAQKQTAEEVIAEAIAAMRRDAMASAAADAVEGALQEGKFEVDQMVKGISLPPEDDAGSH